MLSRLRHGARKAAAAEVLRRAVTIDAAPSSAACSHQMELAVEWGVACYGWNLTFASMWLIPF